MNEKGVYFINKQIKIKEYYPASELKNITFDEIAKRLYKKLLLEGSPIQNVIEHRGNLINSEERAGLIKFFYLEDNTEIPITKAEYVLEKFMETGKNEFLFFVDVIGGVRQDLNMSPLDIEITSHSLFLAHARDSLINPMLHGKWQIIEFEEKKFRLMKIVRDKDKRRISIIIQPNAGYPQRPPMVKTIPKHRDPCFNSQGVLDWTTVKETGRYTWQLYAGHQNPLTYLFEELKTKYKLIF